MIRPEERRIGREKRYKSDRTKGKRDQKGGRKGTTLMGPEGREMYSDRTRGKMKWWWY